MAGTKKIAFVASIIYHFEAFHLPVMKMLQEKGFEVHAYGRFDRGLEAVRRAGVICHDIPFFRSPFMPGNYKALKMLEDSFRAEGFTAVHVHTPVASVIGRMAANKAGVPVVIYTAHGFHFFKGAPIVNWLTFYPVEKHMARQTDYLITINKEDFQRAQGFPVRQEVFYIPGVGLDTGVFAPLDEAVIRSNTRNKLGINDEEIVIICVAEINANKNQIQLIDSVNILAQKGLKVRCLLAGDGPEQKKLMGYVEQSGLADKISFLGFRKDIPDLLLGSDIVCLLSKREGLPRFLLEGIVAGKPVVTTDVRGSRDLVKDGETGIIVPVGDVNKTVQALEKIIADDELRSEMGRRNRELALTFDIKANLETMAKIYERALAGID